MFSFVLMMVAMFAIVYFLMIRPQKKQREQHASLLQSLKKGDEVVLTSGIIGKVFAVEEKTLVLEVANNTRVKVLKQAVSSTSATALGGPEHKKIDKAKKDESDEAEDEDSVEGSVEDSKDAARGPKRKKKSA